MRHDENKSQACWSFQKPDPCWVIPPHEPEDKHPCVQLDSGDALTPEIDDDTSSAQKLLRRYNLDEMGHCSPRVNPDPAGYTTISAQ